MKLLISYLTISLIVIANACSGGGSSSESMAGMDDKSVALSAPISETDANVESDRKLIKTGRADYETSDMATARKNVLDAVKKYNGYISSDDEYKSERRVTATIVVRVPAKNFDKLLADATKGIEKFDNKEINVNDVTEEFLDVQARLKTKKELEARYLNLLKQAKNVTEILEIEKQIGQLRGDIESIEGRLNYLKDRVSLSTLTLSFYKEIPKQIEFGNKFANGFKNGWNNLIWFLIFLVNIWPFIIIIFLIIFGIRYLIRRKKN